MASSKSQVRDHVPKRIKELEFGILSIKDIVNQGLLEISDRNVYDAQTTGAQRQITPHGPMDGRLGTSIKGTQCETCGEELHVCNGHFGHVKLVLPVFHVGYFRMIISILQQICKDCSRVLLHENDRRKHLKSLRRPNLDNLQRNQICKKIADASKKQKICPYCDAVNGPVKKVPGHPLKIIHEKYQHFYKSTAKNKIVPPCKVEFDKSFENAKQGNSELEKHIKKAVDDLDAIRVLDLFRRISNPDCELLGMDPIHGRPEMFIWQYIPAPPVCIRPSVSQEAATTEDDLTNKLGDIIQINTCIKNGLEKKGNPIQTIMEQWEFLAVQVAVYINSDFPGLLQHTGKPVRGFCQRLKGKQGRFRGNLSGKRVNFSGRTVISPDPNLGIDEVAVPQRVAMNLTYPERVSRYNIDKLKDCVKRGPYKHPGANWVLKRNGKRMFLNMAAKRGGLGDIANKLQIGEIVERHLEDGDIVLFNRQPSLHKLSILSHKAKIRPWRTFRLNECVCNPYNADFDGDEMNLHVPQTEEARAEAIELMGVKHNLATPKNGTPIIAAIQDFITAAYLLSNKGNFYDRKTFVQICGYMFDGDSVVDPKTGKRMNIDLPEPAILKPERLWTGKQVFNVLMRPSKESEVLVNLDAPCKQFKAVPGMANDLNEDDAWLVVRNSEVMCGVMDKATVGDGKKDSIFYVIMRDFGTEYAVQAMNRLAKLSARWLTNFGFSMGINDVYPGAELVKKKQLLIEEANANVDIFIEKFKDGKLPREAGCDEDMSLENKISGVLNKVREEAGTLCFQQLSPWNAALLMAICGSKGSNINVSQMVAVVGQQIIGNKRVADGFQDRTLPHFPKAARQPLSKGFVSNSFFSGLSPTEFIFHAMSGREGLVDTAVKTAETGYMSRRLIKSLEDLSSNYDNTIRNSSSGIVQFQYGDDKLDPVDMEAKAKPVNFERAFTSAVTTTWDNEEPGLKPFEVNAITHGSLEIERKKHPRISLKGETLDYNDRSDHGIDQDESKRDFYNAVEDFVAKKADYLAKCRKHVRMMAGREDSDGFNWKSADKLKQRHLADGMAKISKSALHEFIRLCLTKYEKSVVQPGHAVGVVGAQSIGEPGTQMTLKTFHFAGVAGMSITQGVPRIKEIINASKKISTPVITCELANRESETAARFVKSRIEKTYLGDVIYKIWEVWNKDGAYLTMPVDLQTISKLQLGLTLSSIANTIRKTKSLKLGEFGYVKAGSSHIRVGILEETPGKATTTTKKTEDLFTRMQNLKRALPRVVIQGYPEANRAIIKKDDKPNARGIEEVALLVEGYGLKACMTTEGVDGTKCKTNSILEMRDVLGIEAARSCIIEEIRSVMGQMDIDPRHMQLLADVMTYKGDILGITRFGLAKMRDSVLQLASFEKTPDHLFDAAFHMKRDPIEGVSECIIMGQSINIGTGAFKVVRELGIDQEKLKARRKDPVFSTAFKEWISPLPESVPMVLAQF